MGRRKKEEPIVHQNRIAEEAIKLFAKNGIESTKMDEIATAAGYGKATLYVYFENKEDIVSFISYQSMVKLREAIEAAMNKKIDTKNLFFEICCALTKLKENYPAFFDKMLQYIQVDTSNDGHWLSKAYEEGEAVNKLLVRFIQDGINEKVFAPTDNYFETIMLMWAMISGVINMAYEKEEYLLSDGKLTKEEFLQSGFEKIYLTIKK